MMRGPQPKVPTQAGRFGTAHVHVLAVPAESIPLDSAEKPRILFGFPIRKLIFGSNPSSKSHACGVTLLFGLRRQGPFCVHEVPVP